jgi:hypothetical protein
MNFILILSSNVVHKLWKWLRNDRNPSGKATANTAPQLWQPASGILMTNDTSDTNPEEAVSCIALSKNDSYVMSVSGGKVSLFIKNDTYADDVIMKVTVTFNHFWQRSQ